MQSASPNGKKNMIHVVILIIMIFITFFIIFKKTDMDELMVSIQEANKWILLSGIFLIFLVILFGAKVIQLLCWSLKQKITFRSGIKYMCIDYYYAAITPSASGGQPAQAYYMKKHGISLSKSTIVILIVTVLFKLVLLFMGLGALLICSDLVLTNGKLFNILFLLGFLINAIVIVVCLAFMFSNHWLKKIGIQMITFLGRKGWHKHPEKTIKKFKNSLKEYHEGAEYIRSHPKVIIQTFFLTFLQRIAMFTVCYIVYLTFGLNQYSYLEIISLQVVIAIAIDSLPLPGGVGAAEGLFLILYSRIFPGELLMPAMLLTRGISYYFYLIVTGIITVMTHIQIIKKDYKKGQVKKC